MSKPMSLIFHGHDGDMYEISNMPVESTRPEYLASKLERIFRFQGQPRSLSVAQHSALCAQIALDQGQDGLARYCLTHDLAEAFLGDWHGRHKNQGQRDLEAQVEVELGRRGWAVPSAERHHGLVKAIDIQARNIERSLIWPEVFGETDARVEVNFLDMVWLLGAYRGK